MEIIILDMAGFYVGRGDPMTNKISGYPRTPYKGIREFRMHYP